MNPLKGVLANGFARAEGLLGLVFPARANPLANLGALGFFFYWIVTVSGIYVYIFFDTGITAAFTSVEYMTHDQWYAAGVMRSLHRYASDGLIVVMLIHLVREFSLDRYRGVRWFSWVSGVPVMVLVYIAGITGYWLVWDKLAQYVAIVTTEWLDRLPIFGEPIARNFLSPAALENRFFTLMVFMHIAVPLMALGLLWLHLARISRPRINPPRGLALGVFASLLALSLVHPAASQGAADLARAPGAVGLDWFYLPLYPLLETWPGVATWGAGVALLVMLIAMPWLPPLKKERPARVDLDNCNGCERCFADCPYAAITMQPRSDGKPFSSEPRVDPAKCVACGICAGACPTSMPFRRLSALSPGIDLPDFTMADLRQKVHDGCARLEGNARVAVFVCRNGARPAPVDGVSSTAITLNCIGQLPPAFIDYVLSRDLADGVLVSACNQAHCHERFGSEWMRQRLAGERDPHLRARVDRRRVRLAWIDRTGDKDLASAVGAFAEALGRLGRPDTAPSRPGRELIDA